MTTLTLPTPGYQPLTIDDLADVPDDGWRYELIEGALHVSPAADTPHQVIADRLHATLRAAMGSDLEVLEGVNVALGSSLVVPDVVVARASAVGGLAFAPGDVLLAVEIVSRSSRTMDRVTKPSMLAAHGIPAYWRVERDGPAVVVHRLHDANYEIMEVTAGEQLSVDWPVPLTFDPADLVAPRG